MTLVSKAFLVAGVAVLLKAAIGTEKVFVSSSLSMDVMSMSGSNLLPWSLLLNLALAFLLCLVGVLSGAGSFRPTHLSQDPSYRCKDILDARPDFAVFSHRGPLLRSRQL